MNNLSKTVCHYVSSGLCCMVLAGHAAAELRLPAVFGDHMVLQRDAALPVWGWADPGASIDVSLGDASSQTQADDSGRWRVDLQSMDAGGPYTLTIKDGQDTQTYEDVMVGEVWVCSGQSNMDMRLVKIWDDAKIEAELQRDGLRLFRVERATEPEPQDDLDGRWALCEPREATHVQCGGLLHGSGIATRTRRHRRPHPHRIRRHARRGMDRDRATRGTPTTHFHP